MAANYNAVTADQMAEALDQEFIENFRGEFDRFAEILGLFEIETNAAGTALYQYKVTGSLFDGVINASYTGETGETGESGYVPASIQLGASSGTAYIDGDMIARSKYTLTKTPIGEVDFIPYAKETSAKAILKAGYEKAIVRTDQKARQQLRAAIMGDFFALLANGTTTATGVGLQAALAQADAALGTALENNGEEGGRIVYFVNRLDAAEYLANTNVSTQNAFGMSYLENFLGVENVILTSKVAQGTLYGTPVDNIHVYGLDFGALGNAGLNYESDDLGLAGVHHDPDYDHGTANTFLVRGAKFVPEITDFIVKGTVAASA